MSLILVVAKQRPVDLSEFEARLVYKECSEIARTVTQRNHVDKAKRKERKKEKHFGSWSDVCCSMGEASWRNGSTSDSI